MHLVDGNRDHQRIYREVNRRIYDVSASFGEDGTIEFLCECGREECAMSFEIALAESGAILDNGRTFMLAAAHRNALGGFRLLSDHETFLLVVSR